MTPMTQLALALGLSLVWAVAFLVGVDRDAFYPFLGGVAVVVVATALATMSSWRRPSGRGLAPSIGVGLAVGVVTVVMTHVGFALLGGVLPGLADDVTRLQRLAGVTLPRLGLVVLIAVAEELLWRGLLHDALRQLGLRPFVAVPVSAVVYAASQMGPRSPWLLVAGLGCGVLWGALRVRVGLASAIAAHLVWTLAILGALPLG
jgi:membrane protease YdiL (CAAX protease family)